MYKNLKQHIADTMYHKFSPSVFIAIKKAYRFLFGYVHWPRVIIERETEKYVKSLDYKTFRALEISGSKWKRFGFVSYRSVQYPEYDICSGTLDNETFDLIIAEQVLEHVLYPYRAVQNLYRMLNPGGVAVITTPFLMKIHNWPIDCTRWTELGIKHLFIEGGFDAEKIKTGSWGNKACVVANLQNREKWIPFINSLKSEPDFPIAVWAFAQK